MLIGASRKRFLGALLPEGAADGGRDLPTAVISALAARAGPGPCACTTCSAPASPSTSSGALAGWTTWQTGDQITLTGLRVRGASRRLRASSGSTARSSSSTSPWPSTSRAAATSDDLDDTVHYGELAEPVVAAVEGDPVDLIETVAERVAAVALGYPRVDVVEVTVHKPDAPIAVPFADVAVTIIRGRA